MPKTPKIERRNITQEFRVSPDGETPTISGYAALFSVPSDDFGGWSETIDPHAFDSILATNPDVRALWNHNSDCVLGRTAANTLSLNLDARGLFYTINPPDTTLAKDLIVSMRRKDVTQSSFAFVCARDQWTENSDGTVSRLILEFDEILDVSPVTYPAYSATTSSARSLPSTMPKELRSKITKRDMTEDEPVDDDGTDGTTDDADCDCLFPQCLAGACGLCSADEQCDCAERRNHVSESELNAMQMRLKLLSL